MNKTLCLSVLLFVARVGADCQLGAADVSQTNRIFAFSANNRKYPLRVDVVHTHQKLNMICSSQDIADITCQPNGRFKPSLTALGNCSNSEKETVEVVVDSHCPYTTYRVGYKLNDDEFLEIYRSCFDAANQRAHFVKHLVYPVKLNGRPAQAFTTDGIISSAAAATFQNKHIYKRFKELLGQSQSYVNSPRDLVFDRGHLAPSLDFGFEQYMRQTFKYINIVAQFRSINRSNWKTIEFWIRKQLKNDLYPALHVCTGVLDVLQLPDNQGQLTDIYLGARNSNPVPKWLYKLITDNADTCLAILTYNNIHDSMIPSPNCRQVACPLSLQLIPEKESGLTFCCDPHDFIEKNVPQLGTFC
ncbi:uncharacterized protein LOC6575046 [Drosophila mojavensis]|uniref:Uncharacterized protein n=1 Tax=Drosophila mojavensis TaxID=7230 RepID=B4K8E5_DROMO|nr:uncharacterized protein LOC6575046 [Drosophila mojavensis]EDW16527.2 uncharacterized protein Dmoj_GI22179 [Drosophila mojavensis]